jgi:hypothetical protein
MLVVQTSLIFDCDVYVPLHVAQRDVLIKEKDSDEADEILTSAKIIKTILCSCRHSKSSAWVRSMYCVWRHYCVQL